MDRITNYKALSHRLKVWKFQPIDPVLFLGIPAILKVFLGLPIKVSVVVFFVAVYIGWCLRNRPEGYRVSLLRFLMVGRTLPIVSIDEITVYSKAKGEIVSHG